MLNSAIAKNNVVAILTIVFIILMIIKHIFKAPSRD
jgi:hypothetical protein